MRIFLMALPVALMATPVLAQTTPAPPAPAAGAAVQQALTDPATADKLARMMQALSQAFLNLPVGEIEAAAAGRAVTPADKGRTVREVGRRDNPKFEQDLQRDLAASGPMMQASMKALATALPAMMKGMSDARRELEKAAANMPSPNYPRK
ncbi:MAG: hypothetical protein H0V46_03085 [Sphingomonas sp.]|nr:hypothetical protein [Sphingomonas sp.]